GRSMKSSSPELGGEDQNRSTGTPSISQWTARCSEVLPVLPSSRQTRARRSSVSTARVSHLQSAVVFPEPGGPIKTCGRCAKASGHTGGVRQKWFNAVVTIGHSVSSDAGTDLLERVSTAFRRRSACGGNSPIVSNQAMLRQR